MTSTAVAVSIFDTDPATFDALAQVFEVKVAEKATWVRIVDKDTGVGVTFFKRDDIEPETDDIPVGDA